MTKRKKLALSAATVAAAAAAIWIAWGNSALVTTELSVTISGLPESFAGFRIAQVSDLHNDELGEGNSKLLAALEAAKPDITVITGDFLDARDPDLEVCLDFAEKALELAPVYYVPGNHEARNPLYPDLRDGLADLGVTVLEDAAVTLRRSEGSIRLVGMRDPGFFPGGSAEFTETLAEISQYGCDILLSHRPELLETYASVGAGLVLTGHAHGGQVRLPFVGGVVAPHQGFFPEYDAGLYTSGDTSMIVSRGLGNSLFPFRVNNRPELVVATIK